VVEATAEAVATAVAAVAALWAGVAGATVAAAAAVAGEAAVGWMARGSMEAGGSVVAAVAGEAGSLVVVVAVVAPMAAEAAAAVLLEGRRVGRKAAEESVVETRVVGLAVAVTVAGVGSAEPMAAVAEKVGASLGVLEEASVGGLVEKTVAAAVRVEVLLAVSEVELRGMECACMSMRSLHSRNLSLDCQRCCPPLRSPLQKRKR
jgi:hypothetical protein